jgi:hypothetical protein
MAQSSPWARAEEPTFGANLRASPFAREGDLSPLARQLTPSALRERPGSFLHAIHSSPPIIPPIHSGGAF